MAFGAEYVGMSDREILIDQAGDMKAVRMEVKALAINVNNIQCPSQKCKESFEIHEDHEKRLAEQERIEKERCKKQVGKKEMLMWAIGIIATTIVSNFIVLLALVV